MYKKYLKRFVDLFLSILIFPIVLPILVLTSVSLFLSNKGRILFIQQRPGHHGKPFPCFKFRTMNDLTDSDGIPLSDEERLTPIGRLVRRLSLDEVLQLINVIRGEMSLVGPRPLLMQYLPLYSEKQKRRHEVKPGITGYAQVNGRNSLTWDEKFEHDLFYVDNVSFWLDLKILSKTLYVVIIGLGVSSSSHITMEPFMGNTPKRQTDV